MVVTFAFVELKQEEHCEEREPEQVRQEGSQG